MSQLTLLEELQNRIQELTPLQQQKVLDFVRTLKDSPKGTPGVNLLSFAGFLSYEEGQSLSDAIHKGCGQVKPGDW